MPDESIFHGARLCVVGNINRDVKTAPFPEGEYLFGDGETAVSAIFETIGGGGANSAAAAAALGARCEFVGQIGDDALGRQLEGVLTGAGVLCRLHRAPGLATGTTINLVYAGGTRHFLSCHPNNLTLQFETLDLSPLQHVDHLYRADIWFSEAMLFGGNRKLLEAARAAGVATSLDVNWDPKWGRAAAAEVEKRKEAVRAILPLVDLVHGNERELCEFSGVPEVTTAIERILAAGTGAVVLHMGSRGAGYFSGSEAFIEPPAPARTHVSSTGTGDVLSVCMMLMHHRAELAVPERLRLANRIVAEFIEGRRRLIPTL